MAGGTPPNFPLNGPPGLNFNGPPAAMNATPQNASGGPSIHPDRLRMMNNGL